MNERGVLKVGYAADLTWFDPNTVNDRSTYENPHQYPVGTPTVVVNGQVVLDQGRHTGAKPGKVLRGSGYALMACLAPWVPAVTAQDFGTTLRPVLAKAGCPACHTPDGVAAATRLRFPLSFPPAGAPAAKWEAFGRSLVELTAPVNLLRDKPTGGVTHAGGARFAPGSEGDRAVEAWVRRLNQLTPAERAEALQYREREAAAAG